MEVVEQGVNRLPMTFQSQPGKGNVGYRYIDMLAIPSKHFSWEFGVKSGLPAQIDEECGLNPVGLGRLQGFEHVTTVGFGGIVFSSHKRKPLSAKAAGT